MADSRRSRRSTKEVSYASLDGNDDSDDDFANFTPPPTKKAKKKTSKRPTDRPKSAKRKAPAERRAVVDDAAFDSDLQLALAMSQEDGSPQSRGDESPVMSRELADEKPTESKSSGVVVDIHIPDTNEPKQEQSPQNGRIEPILVTSPKEPVCLVKNNEDEISFIETVDPEEKTAGGRGQRRAAKTAANKQRALLGNDDNDGCSDDESGDEYKADDADLDESDGGEDESGDGDFSLSPVKKKRKASSGKVAKKETTRAPASRKPAAKRDTKKKANENTAPKPVVMEKTPLAKRSQAKKFAPPSVTSNSASKSPNLPAVRQIRRSPLAVSIKDSDGSNPLGGVNLVSAGQPFRLGLSRFARVRPLHSNAKVT